MQRCARGRAGKRRARAVEDLEVPGPAPEGLLRLAHLGDVHVDADHAQERAGGREARTRIGAHQAPGAVGAAVARLDRERTLRLHGGREGPEQAAAMALEGVTQPGGEHEQ